MEELSKQEKATLSAALKDRQGEVQMLENQIQKVPVIIWVNVIRVAPPSGGKIIRQLVAGFVIAHKCSRVS